MKATAFLAGLAALGAAARDCGGGPLTPEKLEADVTTEGLQKVLQDLNKIADANGGNRAFGLPGFEASRDYILGHVKERLFDTFDTWVQSFTHLFERTNKIWVKGPEGENVYVISLMYNHPTPLPGGTTGELIDTPVDDERGSGCFEDQWAGIDATGKIALVKRGICAISDKLKLAKAHGAVAVILYNQNPGTSYGSATLSASNYGQLVPVGVVPLEVGTAWKQRLAGGESLTVTLLVDSVFEQRECWNVFAETKEGDPDSVVMLGAHLDSVQAGPGVNDDGSGTAALVNLAHHLKKYSGFKNKVRLAWWGAEESGLIGSLYYGNSLTPEEADKIKFYFNYDMIGSIEPIYAIYRDDEGDEVGGSILLDWLTAHGAPAYYAGFGSSSDYVAFLELGIPSSGIFTGAGAPEDPCYHQACDTTNNIHWDAITLNTKAAAYALGKFALDMEAVPPRKTESLNPRSQKGVRRGLIKWAAAATTAANNKACSHSQDNTV